MSVTTCANHKCPLCSTIFSHNLYFSDNCIDMKKCLRACDDCITKDKAKLYEDTQPLLFDTA